MPITLFQLASTLAETAAEADKRGLLRSAFWLWLGLTALALIALTVLWLLTSSLTRKVRGVPRPRRRRRIKDAWSESGKRIEPISHDDMQPDATDDPEADEPGGPT